MGEAIFYKQCTLLTRVPETRWVTKGRGRKRRKKTVFVWKAIKVMRPKPPPKEWGEYPVMNPEIDIRTHQEKKSGWWIEKKATVHCIVSKDGLVVAFRRQDVEEFMDRHYPYKWEDGNKKWYFNSTLDREIAEIDLEDRVSCNPQVLWQHFTKQTRVRVIRVTRQS